MAFVVVVQSLSPIWLFVTPWTEAHKASLSFTISRSFLKQPSNHLNIWHPHLLLPSILPSFRVISNKLTLHIRWPKYWSFSFSISPPNKYSGLIFFRMNWLDLLGVQVILKSLLQHHGSKTSILQCSAFFMVQHSYSYMTTGKTIALTRRTFFSKLSLLLNMLSDVVIAFLSRSKNLLI